MRRTAIALCMTSLLLLFGNACQALTKAGFDLSNAIIPTDAVMRGGPPPDGIPSIDNPEFTAASKVDYLKQDDVVIGISMGDDTRAYPLRILIWHEIVNDTINGTPIVVTYCPLCGTAMIMEREYDGLTLSFGVSGLLYNSDVLMFDRETKSLWSQLKLKAVSGEYVGTEMVWLPGEQMTWETWRQRYPASRVLNMNTGHHRDYDNLPYQSYRSSRRTLFPFEKNRDELASKTWIAGVSHNEAAKAYPLDRLPPGVTVEDTIGGAPVTLCYDKASGHLEVRDADNQAIPVVHAFWFAWQAFYPETEIYEEP